MGRDELATPEQLDMFHHPERFAEPPFVWPTVTTAAEPCSATRERLISLINAFPPKVVLTVAVRS